MNINKATVYLHPYGGKLPIGGNDGSAACPPSMQPARIPLLHSQSLQA